MLKTISMLMAAAALVTATAPVDARPKERASVDARPKERAPVDARQRERGPDNARQRERRPDARQREREPDNAFAARQQGRILPLPQIEARVRQQMRGADYLGPELDTASGRYRLKFMRGERVIWIDVDGRTGQVVGRSGR